ncbi:DUF4183 domain-containing protein [Paenibacillus sedimenti]|uniref:DUF4183 domain-containing protein n=1 Tax=Paenibacillus sedimenti TaxID=2770274 RepID=A0A926KSR4_9BACL|nr:DUF4183 domain-containing protein [Paenibacillus sedimenti]MBD0383447.1 DUF4183 domain-containing protein [Paenibacillus sedimenti]
MKKCIKRCLRKCAKKKRKIIKKKLYGKTYFFYAVSDGEKNVYTEQDKTPGYGIQRIPSPKSVSYAQVFVNGVLQPKSLYRIRDGSIRFTSDDVPEKGVPIIVQSIRICR